MSDGLQKWRKIEISKYKDEKAGDGASSDLMSQSTKKRCYEPLFHWDRNRFGVESAAVEANSLIKSKQRQYSDSSYKKGYLTANSLYST